MGLKKRNIILFFVAFLCIITFSVKAINAQSDSDEYSPYYNFYTKTYKRSSFLNHNSNFVYRHYLDNKFIGSTTFKSRKKIKKYIEPGTYKYKITVGRATSFSYSHYTFYKKSIHLSKRKVLITMCGSSFLFGTRCNSEYLPRVKKERTISETNDYEIGITFNEDLSIETSTIEEVTVDPGVVKSYSRNLSHSYDISLAENYRSILVDAKVSTRVISKIAKKLLGKVEDAAFRQYGYKFGQRKTEGVSVTLNGSVCTKYRIEKITKLRTGKAILTDKAKKQHELDFNIIDHLDIDAKNLCLTE